MMRRVVRTLWRVALAGVAVYAAAFLWLVWQVSSAKPAPARADAVLVLGARVFYPQKPWINPCLRARVAHGARLVAGGTAPWLIVSGGLDHEDGAIEAEHMRDLAVQLGVKPSRVLLEARSTSTRENMVFSRAILEARKLEDVIVVTEPFHAPRAALLARRAGLRASVSPAPGSPCSEDGRFAARAYLREPLAILENLVRGWL